MIFRAAIVQMASSSNLEENLIRMENWIREAAAQKADAVFFPELACFMAPREACSTSLSQYQSLCATFSSWAKSYQIAVFPGSMREPLEGESRVWNTLLGWDAQGRSLLQYRKIHLFRASLPGQTYDETRDFLPGERVETADLKGWRLGAAICFDLRFPEVFRKLRELQAQIFYLPAAFTVPTGKAHWEVLLRARAIENQVFVIASNQVGKMGNGQDAYGHSCVISPWGEILQCKSEGEGVFVQELESAALHEASARVPAWESRVFP